jgi:hypothetical protein
MMDFNVARRERRTSGGVSCGRRNRRPLRRHNLAGPTAVISSSFMAGSVAQHTRNSLSPQSGRPGLNQHMKCPTQMFGVRQRLKLPGPLGGPFAKTLGMFPDVRGDLRQEL